MTFTKKIVAKYSTGRVSVEFTIDVGPTTIHFTSGLIKPDISEELVSTLKKLGIKDAKEM